MKLQIESVEFKNFLSFGSRVTKVPFLPGVNLVSGIDVDKQKSNGAGKSSFLETVPFALFGQVHRNIKKEQITNWKNRRNCEVIVNFKKGESEFSVLRSIKPDNFEIYQDGTLIDKPSHIRDYQLILNEILGINFPAFMSLIHSNINSSAKILSMKKPDKRKFMETMFGLSLYTKLNERCNSKLKTLREKIREIDLTVATNSTMTKASDQRMLDLHKKVRKLFIPQSDLNEARENLKDLESKFDEHSDELKDISMLSDVSQMERERWSGIRERVANSCIPIFKMKVKGLREAFAIREKAEADVTALRTLEEMYGSKDDVEVKRSEALRKASELQDKEIVLLEKREIIHGVIQGLTSDINSTEHKLQLLDEDKCPTCGREFDDEDLYDETKSELMGLETTLTRKQEKKLELIGKQAEIRSEYLELKRKTDYLRDAFNKMVSIFDRIKHLEDDSTFEKWNDDIVRYERTEISLIRVKSDAENTIIECDKNIGMLHEREAELKHYIVGISELERKIRELVKEADTKKDMKKDLLEMIHKDDMNIKTLSEDSRKQSKKKSRLVEIKDYLEFVKMLCEDKHLKQHAISSIIPYMNKQTNFYLSEVDYGFYTVLDKWLDAEIKGPGVTNASYGSLSGGEGRGIDIAIQFAFLDIARLQAGIFPDYLTFDELLDSSIDGKGITELFRIIKTRQKDDESKIFIISHRTELDDADEIDNVYHVIKENGYSRLEIRS